MKTNNEANGNKMNKFYLGDLPKFRKAGYLNVTLIDERGSSTSTQIWCNDKADRVTAYQRILHMMDPKNQFIQREGFEMLHLFVFCTATNTLANIKLN